MVELAMLFAGVICTFSLGDCLRFRRIMNTTIPMTTATIISIPITLTEFHEFFLFEASASGTALVSGLVYPVSTKPDGCSPTGKVSITDDGGGGGTRKRVIIHV